MTTKLGTTLRNFAKLTATLGVRETTKEYTRRKRQAESSKATSMARQLKNPSATRGKTAGATKDSASDGRRLCFLNLNTYKMHAFGDYPSSIEEFGTTDSFSTQIVRFVFNYGCVEVLTNRISE